MDDPNEIKLYTYTILIGINEKQMKIYLDKHLSFPFKSLLLIYLQ
jgi:hypothetical protein